MKPLFVAALGASLVVAAWAEDSSLAGVPGVGQASIGAADRSAPNPRGPGEIDRVAVFGGYSFQSVDTNGNASRQSMNGWEAGIGVNFNKWVGAEGDVSGYYEHLGTVAGGDVGAHDYIVAGGPRVTVKPVFFHALVGVDRFTSYVNANGSIFVSSSSTSQSSLAVLFGGGVEWKIWHHVALRPSLDYVLTRRGSPTRLTQNNVRLGAAIEYAFGR